MNITKRTFNPLLGRRFRYDQPEDAELKYQGNWGVLGLTVSTSEWEKLQGDAVLSGDALASNVTSVTISGEPGDSIIVNKVTFSDGQIDSRIILLKITDNDLPKCEPDYCSGC